MIGIIKNVATFITYVAIVCGSIVLMGCKRQEEPRFKIGVSQCSGGQWRDKMNREMEREMLFHPDSYIEILCAYDNNEKQIEDIQSFIDRDFDIIIVAPNESEALTPIVRKAYEKGIPVVIFDRRIVGDSYSSYIDLDNKGIGESAAVYSRSLLSGRKSKVLEIKGLEGSSPAQERHEGFTEVLSGYPEVDLVASVSADWDRDKAYAKMDSLIGIYPDIDLVYAHNDYMALGVDSLLREKGLRHIKVLGTDASPGQGLEAVRDGNIDATFIYPTEGHRIINTAFDILEGNGSDRLIRIPSLAPVDKNNADVLIRQNTLLDDETSKVLLLNEINTGLEARHHAMTNFLNAVVTLAIVLFLILGIAIFLLIRNQKLQKELKLQNEKLIEERDRQRGLYQQLDSVLSKGDDFYNSFMNIIRSDYSDSSLNTETMASKLNLGGAQLTRKIKSLTNYSPVEILRNYRLEQARNLLLTTSKNINEITFEVGFSSAPYLTKCFREHFGMTPTELRTSN